MILPIWAETSNQVSVTIPEICRYRIENVTFKYGSGDKVIQAVAVAILSNSKRQWRFIAIPKTNLAAVEWSVDGLNWQSFAGGDKILLSGNRSPWNNYQILYRYPCTQQGARPDLPISYQLLFVV